MSEGRARRAVQRACCESQLTLGSRGVIVFCVRWGPGLCPVRAGHAPGGRSPISQPALPRFPGLAGAVDCAGS
eukprot:5228011-Pyramimonas_sp.AAC.1